MNKQEIKQEIQKLENEIFMEQMKDRGYRCDYVNDREEKIRKLKKVLSTLEE